ncbi:alpha/beta fold hydrolase [Ruminococcus sp.]|uniref:thioesterase II family protein n=1 Tax=Ruminococcus sp. TaxID=41978 RepID=UPI001B71902A|nr:alpha/beta fold hydrolase [Ruminococcus sp.]MBP5431355.1 thioesterase [Ruminococcus sp.]
MVLFFLPHAGGSAKSYSSFKRFLPKELTVVPMELSGRFTRPSEPLLDTIPDCVTDLINKHSELLRGDYALFGHSMGTALVTELVRQAKKNGLAMPCHIFLSGKNPPDEDIHCFEHIKNASDEEIVSFFTKNSLSSDVPVPDHALVKLLNRILCTDVRMAEGYRATPEDVKFPCDITALYGIEDPLMQRTDMQGWNRFTDGKCEVIPFSGDHFYFNEHKEEVCSIIKKKLHI